MTSAAERAKSAQIASTAASRVSTCASQRSRLAEELSTPGTLVLGRDYSADARQMQQADNLAHGHEFTDAVLVASQRAATSHRGHSPQPSIPGSRSRTPSINRDQPEPINDAYVINPIMAPTSIATPAAVSRPLFDPLAHLPDPPRFNAYPVTPILAPNTQHAWETSYGRVPWTGAYAQGPLPQDPIPLQLYLTPGPSSIYDSRQISAPLLSNPYGNGLPQVVWNISQPLFSAMYFAGSSIPVSVHQLNNTPATVPSIAILNIKLPMSPIIESIWGSIWINSSSSIGQISCFDVLEGIQAYMHQTLTPNEMARIQSQFPALASMLSGAGVFLTPGSQALWTPGNRTVRRVDLLLGESVFGGINMCVGADGLGYANLLVKSNKVMR